MRITLSAVRIGASSVVVALAAMSLAVRFRAGTVLMVEGRVFIKGPGQLQRELTGKDVNKPVFVGDKILCAKRGRLKVRQRDGAVIAINASSGWVQLRLARTKEEEALYLSLTGGDNPLRAANRPAAKPKSQIEPFVPDHDEAACAFFRIDLPDGFPKRSPIYVRLEGERTSPATSTALFTGNTVDGSLHSNRLRNELEMIRDKGNLGPFAVEAVGKGGGRCVLRNVFLMSAEKESSLLSALAQAEKAGDEYAKSLCRVSVLKKYGLVDLAQEQLAGLPEP